MGTVAVKRSADDAAGLYGRAAELDQIGRFLDDVPNGPAALLLEGPAGIGKTTLWAAGMDMARRRGWWVLSCRPVQSEAPLSFSALGDLFDAVPETALAGLPGPQRHALEVALLRAEPGPDPPDQRAVAVALLGVIRALADTAPVLVGVDDASWLDRSSADAVEYALRRLVAQPAGLLATVASGGLANTVAAADPPSAVASGDLAGTMAVGAPDARPRSLRWELPQQRLHRVNVGPLSLDSLAALLRDKGGVQGSWPEVVELCEASGGNPYLALELAAALGANGGGRGAGQPLPVPDSLQPLVQRRLRGLPPVSQDVALLVAASAQPSVGLVLAASGNAQLAQDGLDSAEAAGVLQVAGGHVRFTHPLLRSLHYASATERQRRRAHQRLAEATAVPEERVRHRALAAAEPDEQLAGQLAAAAQVACRRGAAVAAAELADLAHDRTPPELAAARVGRLVEAGRLHLTAFDPGGARRLLEAAIELCEPGQVRAAALHDLARVIAYSEGLSGCRSLLVQARDEAADGSALKALVHRDLGFVMGLGTDGFTGPAIAEFRAAQEIARGTGDKALISQLLAFEAMTEFVTGNGLRRDLIARALADRDPAVRIEMELRPRVVLSHVLRSADDLAGARALLAEEYAEATDQGAETDLPFLLMHLAVVETWAGNLELAEEYAEHGYRVALAADSVTMRACMHCARAITWAFRGPLDSARTEAEAAIDAGLRSGVYYALLVGCHALSLVELVSGNPAGGRASLAAIVEVTGQRGMVDPGFMALRPVPDYIESLIRLGDLAAADPLLVSLEERARRLDRAWALAAAGRCRALMMSARGDHDAAAAALERAFAAHERIEMPLELARTHLVAGDVARRARRRIEAREHVETARQVFVRLGAAPWAQRADAELARLGAARAVGLDLTAAERRVASLVASGRTNREVAAELYMGLRTVETHLSAVYRKLGVRSRSELIRTWGQRPDPD
jgi:DNA-binding CsgD family transcriptional regulator